MSADLAVIVDDPSILERSADPGEFLVLACERAKSWLAEALDHGEIDRIAEMKAQADAIRVYTVSKQLGKDAQLSATEIVRRAERGIGIAIRRGQDNGTIRRQGQGRGYTQQLPKPSDFASHEELMGNQAGIYDLTDDVPDGDFEAALSEAKTDGNLSRANVVRKIRAATDPAATDRSHAAVQRLDLIREWAEQGHSSRQIAGHLNLAPAYVRKIARDARIEIKADAVVGRSQRIDSNRVVSETVGAMEGIASGIRLVDIEDLDCGHIREWVASLTESVRALNRLIRQMKELTQ